MNRGREGLVVINEDGEYLVEGSRKSHGGEQLSFRWVAGISEATLWSIPEAQLLRRLKDVKQGFKVLKAREYRHVRLEF